MRSLIIPVYKLAVNLPYLLPFLEALHKEINDLEIVFVCDGIREDFELLKTQSFAFQKQIILHSNNFGSYNAIRTGIAACKGEYMAITSQDGQEPLDLIIKMFNELSTDKADVCFASRANREDKRFTSTLFWKISKIIFPKMPEGGVDVFAINLKVKEELLKLTEHNQFLVGSLFYLGFRQSFIAYERLDRNAGKSTFTFMKRLNLAIDSFFVFTDLPIKMLFATSFMAVLLSIIYGLILLIAKLFSFTYLPQGFTTTIFLISFFGSINLFALSIIGFYLSKTYENSKHRPYAIIAEKI